MSRLLHLVHWLENGLLVLILSAMIALAGSQIVMRNLFDSGIAWADPIVRVLVLWIGMIGAMLASQQDKHIRIDLLSRHLPAHWLRYSTRLTELFSAILCALLAWQSGRFVYFEWQDGTTLFDYFPSWLAESILPVGFAVMALRFAILVIVGRVEGTR